MKQQISTLIQTAINTLQQQGVLPAELSVPIQIEQTKNPEHGDYACNIALLLAKAARAKPADIAKQIVEALPASPLVDKVTIAGPGFINFSLNISAFQAVIPEVLSKGDQYGRSNLGQGEKIHLEFVSSNPTGPLHVGHGRSAAYGASLGNVLDAVGYNVYREYYVNDAGRQMNILATSLWLRYLKECGEEISFSDQFGYKGNYLIAIAEELKKQYGDKFHKKNYLDFINSNTPTEQDTDEKGITDAYTDKFIAGAKELLDKDYDTILNFVLERILGDIKQDLSEFGVNFDNWFSEHSLVDSKSIEHAIEKLKQGKYLYEQNGAQWFRSTDFGDDKDRVVVRDNGQPTYFASDLAYFFNKHERGFKHCLLVLGADHHSYVTRLKAAAQALGFEPNNLEIPIVQFAVLYRGAERVQMSTRSGSFVTLRELREEVGNDAARFFYVMRKCEQHLDFDLELAKSKSNENPVYYIQYAHARICSIWRQCQEKNLTYEQTNNLSVLDNSHEKELLIHLINYPSFLEAAATGREPHLIAHYLRELASSFHAYYNAHAFLVDDAALRNARLSLIKATQYILANGLKLLGVSAPDSM